MTNVKNIASRLFSEKESNPDNNPDNNVKNIVSKDISTTLNINGESIRIEVKGAKFGDVNEKTSILLDEHMFNGRLNDIAGAFARTATKYNEIPKKIVIYNKEEIEDSSDKNENKSLTNSEEPCNLFNAYDPKWELDDIYLKKESKDNILTALTMIKHKDKLFNEWNIKGNKNNGRALCLNFWGSPGTGKSMTAEGVASYLNKKILIVNYPELESKYVGETPKNIKRVFEKAKEEDAVIVFDEADSFLGKRLENVTQSADYGVNITRSVMLIELENFDGVIIFTTNLLNNYDEAFKRRILANIEFEMPDEAGRRLIWQSHLPKEMPVDTGVNKEVLAEKFDNITGADIKDIILMAATEALRKNKEVVILEDFEYAYNIIMKRYVDQKKVSGYKVITEKISEEQYLKEAGKSIDN